MRKRPCKKTYLAKNVVRLKPFQAKKVPTTALRHKLRMVNQSCVYLLSAAWCLNIVVVFFLNIFIFNLRRYRLNFALRYSSPRVNYNSSVKKLLKALTCVLIAQDFLKSIFTLMKMPVGIFLIQAVVEHYVLNFSQRKCIQTV